MIRLAANLSTLFTELPFLDRFGAAAAAGFRHVECQFPYAVPAAEVAARLRDHGLQLALFNAPPGDAAAGERGLACLPGREAAFDASLDLALHYLEATGCRRLHVMAGLPPAGADPAACEQLFIERIARAARRLAPLGATVMIEPINTRVDVPGYLLSGTAQALRCLEAAAEPNIRLQYDCYHMQIMEGDLARSIARLLPHIGHIQIADNPGRHEPGTGEVAWGFLLSHIDRLGYTGIIGCEYLPATTTLGGLAWARPWLATEHA
ncbi:MAG: hydroxypyruvate isomerase [Pseudomonadota bacterium]